LAGISYKADIWRTTLDELHLTAPPLTTVRDKVPNQMKDRSELLWQVPSLLLFSLKYFYSMERSF